ncbi:MAG: copper resistance system multicopper oxidase [Pseudomonadota bacterium]|nr:copper resistance system multicopper oxidase [Pseudomonadota bacterium]
MLNRALYADLAQPSRRRFVHGLAAGGVVLGLAPFARSLRAAEPTGSSAPELRGTVFNLDIGETPVNFTGAARVATTINGSVPAPTLRWREGDEITIHVRNRLQESTSIHWHGIILPFQMDGVPGLSFAGIPAGATFTYRFKVEQSGTYWYHSHSGFQEQTGMYGAIVVEPRGGPAKGERDHVLLLSDWTDENPMRMLAKLKTQSDIYNYNRPTAQDFARDVSKHGLRAALQKRQMWNQMRMNPTDLSDMSSATMTYLMNGNTSTGNWTGMFRPGEKLRLRCINGSANTFYDVRIPGLKLTVVQSDGNDIDPVTVDEFRFGPGETYDVLVTPKDDAYTVFAQSIDRTGYARGTLAARAGLTAPVPALDLAQPLTMADMMGAMGMGSMAGMDHGAMSGMKPMDHSAMAGMQGMDHSAMAGMGAPAGIPISQGVRHARTEYGASTDMRVDMPRNNLDDPGVGLRDNGRRVLTLSDLHTVGGPLDPRGAERELELHLTGNMERYTWSFDGLEFGQSTPVALRYGERVRIILSNDTMMTHPMHLHGMWSELEAPDGSFQARRHTIPVQPAQKISFLLTADALGRWAWHCHLLTHMEAGMFREVVVA